MSKVQKPFDADVAQLIQLVTHSIYSNKDIFLRELIANANDALQKAKLLGSQDTSYLGDEHDLSIKISVDQANNTITIEDTGVGMSQDEAIENLGTIAKSGTKAFMEQLAKKKDQQNELIGQFGIGFYSAFMIADRVEVDTKAVGHDAVLWSSDGKGTYEIEESDKKTRGTIIRLFVKEEEKEYVDHYRLRSLITKHANYVPVPIQMNPIKEGTVEDPTQWEQINKMTSLWSRQKNEVSEEDYQEFYTSLTYDQEKPLDTLHIAIEGGVTFKALLYIPKKPPLFGGMQSEQDYGPSLYVQNVLILENAKELLPVWLRFVKGVVETPDLSLNVSRELIQSSQTLAKIQKILIKEIMKSLAWIAKEQKDDYKEFFSTYGRFLKEGVHYDRENKEQIAGLLLYGSSDHDSLTLDEYLQNAGVDLSEKKSEEENDDKRDLQPIYYLTGPSRTQLLGSPYLEQFKKAEKDVLLMDDPIDEWVVGSLTSYKGHDLKSITSHDVQVDATDETAQEKKKEIEKTEAKEKDFLTFVQAKVGTDRLEKVIFTDALDESVGVLVTQDGQTSAQMERIMEAMGQQVQKGKRILSLNVEHPLVKQMIDRFHQNKDDSMLQDLIAHTYDQAVLLEGGVVEDMSTFLKRSNRLISAGDESKE